MIQGAASKRPLTPTLSPRAGRGRDPRQREGEERQALVNFPQTGACARYASSQIFVSQRQAADVVRPERAVGRDAGLFEQRGDLAGVLGRVPNSAFEHLVA